MLADPEKGAKSITIEVQTINQLYPYDSTHMIIAYKMIRFGKNIRAFQGWSAHRVIL
jgi:hypothetical protein